MSDQHNRRDIATIQSRLGPLLDDLNQTMLDGDTAPLFLFSSGNSSQLVEARGRAVAELDLWSLEEPDVVNAIYERLMSVLQKPDAVSESLLEAVMWVAHSEPSVDLFERPSPSSRVFAAAPNLVPLLDESGLVSVNGLDARPWGLHTGDYAFHYHQFLRRNFGSNIHYELIGTVLGLARQYDLVARLALDERRIRFRESYEEWEERDHWYGPGLVDDNLDDLLSVGETFHGDPDLGLSWMHPYAGLSVRWTADGPLKGVEIEEFMPPPKPGAEWVLARYLHAIRDTEKKAFIHCDGAVKAFAADRYPTSQQDFRTRGKGDRYRKLFRVDGAFPATAWSEIACSWFRGNKLILEYFSQAT